jgi:hypothetical protein
MEARDVRPGLPLGACSHASCDAEPRGGVALPVAEARGGSGLSAPPAATPAA